MDSPIALVTLTLTTDELAKSVAGLNLLRKEWSRMAMDAGILKRANESSRALIIVQEITDLIARLAGTVSEEQGAALMGDLIRDLKKRGSE